MEEKREKSNMELWAEEEIRIACERERGGTSEDMRQGPCWSFPFL